MARTGADDEVTRIKFELAISDWHFLNLLPPTVFEPFSKSRGLLRLKLLASGPILHFQHAFPPWVVSEGSGWLCGLSDGPERVCSCKPAEGTGLF